MKRIARVQAIRAAALAAALSHGWLGASAQQVPTDPPGLEETVVVTATRQEEDALDVPAAIDRIDAAEIRRAQPLVNLSESLQRVPGVVARDRQNFAQDLQISIRGFGARATFGVRGVRLYTDGIPATMPDGQGQVSHFLLDDADRIEVLRGPFSALYGNSSGGVIQLFSADPPARRELHASLVAGHDSMLRGGLGWRGPWAGGHPGGYSLSLTDLTTDGYRAHSEARRTVAQASFKGAFSGDGTFVAIANVLDTRADDPQGLTADELAVARSAASPGAVAFDTRKSTRQQQLGARLEQPIGAASGISFGAYAGARSVEQFLSVPVAAQANPLSGGGVVDLDRDYFGADARWRWQGLLVARPFVISLGVEHQVSDERRRGFENFVGSQLGVRGALRRDEDNRVVGTDQYLQAEWHLSESVGTLLGVRRSEVRFRSDDDFITIDNPDDSGRIDYGRITPVAGVLWRVHPWLSLYANAGEGFETPTFNELAYRNDGGSGLNTDLRPASSDSFEAGLRASRNETRVGFALFRSLTDHELVIASNRGGRSTFANAAVSRRQGAELSWSGAWSPRWRYALTYTYLEARYRRDFAVCATVPCAQPDEIIAAGNRIPGLPMHTAWTEVRWQRRADIDLALAASAVGRVFADDENSAAASGFASIDFSGERRWLVGGVELAGFVRCNNLLDRETVGSVIVNESNGRYFEPAPGRIFLAGIRASIAARSSTARRSAHP